MNVNMTSVILQLAEKNNLTLCSTIPEPASYSYVLSTIIAVAYIGVCLVRRYHDGNELIAQDTTIDALEASNTALSTQIERFRGRIVQLFGERGDLKHILLGGKGMGVPLRVTIDGKTVIVRVDPEKDVDQQSTLQQQSPPPFEQCDAPRFPLRINTAVDRTLNQQDIPPAPSPAGERDRPSPSNAPFGFGERVKPAAHRHVSPAAYFEAVSRIAEDNQPAAPRASTEYQDLDLYAHDSGSGEPVPQANVTIAVEVGADESALEGFEEVDGPFPEVGDDANHLDHDWLDVMEEDLLH